MKIIFVPEIMLRLMTIATKWRGEFSGFGFVTRKDKDLYVYDFVLLALGSEAYTEIPTEKIVALMERSDAGNMKLWLHRHPLGNGYPGKHNWSGTDHATIMDAPLGGIPEMVKWSASVVLTPGGWVGRVDNHIKKSTIHCSVEPQAHEAYAAVIELNRQDPVLYEVDGNPELFEVYLKEATAFVKSRHIDLDALGMTLEDIADEMLTQDLDLEDLEDLARGAKEEEDGSYETLGAF